MKLFLVHNPDGTFLGLNPLEIFVKRQVVSDCILNIGIVEINILMLLMREIRATSVNLSAFYLPSCCVGAKIRGFFLEPSVNII